MNIALIEMGLTIGLWLIIPVIIISQIIAYIHIGRYEKRVKKLLGEHYANYFDWDTMKNFYDFSFEPIEAAREMIAAGRCKPN